MNQKSISGPGVNASTSHNAATLDPFGSMGLHSLHSFQVITDHLAGPRGDKNELEGCPQLKGRGTN